MLVDLQDGQVVRCRVVNITDDGAVQVVPEHEVAVGTCSLGRWLGSGG